MNPGTVLEVAVVITTYNHAHFLAAAIESVLTQSHPASEILVIDDGSADDPSVVTSRFAGVRLIRQANCGLAAARNTGLRASRSPLLLFLDADDRLRPEAIRYGLRLLAADTRAAFAYSGYDIVDARGTVPTVFRPVPASAFGAFLRENPIGMHATVLYRRGPIEAAGGFCKGLPACEDYDLYLRLSEQFPITCGPEVTAEYWHHGSNMSGDAALMLSSALRVLRSRGADAVRHGQTLAYRAGLNQWKQYYCTAWAGRMLRRPGDLTLIRQGVQLAWLAPAQFAGLLARSLRRRFLR